MRIDPVMFFGLLMIVGIDASNIRAGGGVTHLKEVLGAAQPARFGFEKVVVWSSAATLAKLPDREWLEKRSEPSLEGGLRRTMAWQMFDLASRATQAGCDLLFVPGGSFTTARRPIVTMSQNLLPFDWRELLRYGVSAMTLKLIALRISQSRSFRKASGTIFLTEAAKQTVLAVTGPLSGATVTIPHGIDQRFAEAPRSPRSLADCSAADPFRVIYVSAVEHYKHQWHVAEAVAALRAEGLPISLDLIGPANPAVLPKLQKVLARVDPAGEAIRYTGMVPYDELHTRYRSADLCVFASSCETIANILIEGMAGGVPTVCSDIGPMREVLGDGGIYCDPESPTSIAEAIRAMVVSPELRLEKARIAFERSKHYSWTRCADETFAFLASVLSGTANETSGKP
ncbi:glycosyltransferase family 1 protein [Devosia sp.]|uniref:glycosyltransferase family 4 protein n=2 Tax=Devosia sp. TaxID=1871048 RepID=UPI003266B3E4